MFELQICVEAKGERTQELPALQAIQSKKERASNLILSDLSDTS
jgi:hypothetical protein